MIGKKGKKLAEVKKRCGGQGCESSIKARDAFLIDRSLVAILINLFLLQVRERDFEIERWIKELVMCFNLNVDGSSSYQVSYFKIGKAVLDECCRVVIREY